MNILLHQPLSFQQQGKRSYQEDARFPENDTPDINQRFFLVCDGVGGSEHGEVASQTVCQAFGKKMKSFNLSEDFSNKLFSQALDYAYEQLDKAAENIEGDMATTLTFVCFHEKGATMAHIGDSRIYQIRPDLGIIYKSDDHSLVNNLVHNGVISPEKAEFHPQRNVITRCMEPVADNEERAEATVVRTADILPSDYFFLCSDGVLHDIDDEKLVVIICDPETSNQQKIQKIAGIAADSDDNNTAILLQISHIQDAPDIPAVKAEDSRPTPDDEVSVTTNRFPRKITETLEVESFKKPESKGFFSRLKKIFSH